jgi:hypothetical protein
VGPIDPGLLQSDQVPAGTPYHLCFRPIDPVQPRLRESNPRRNSHVLIEVCVPSKLALTYLVTIIGCKL